MKIIKEYDAKADSKHRVTIRSSEHEYYHVQIYENGKVVMEPRLLVVPDSSLKVKMKENR